MTKATEALKKFKYDVPNEIREDEAHLNHIIVAQATPNVKTMEFDTVAKLVKLNDESLAVVKTQLPKHGVVVILHDGKQYRADKSKSDQEVKERAKAEKEAEDEAKAKAEKEKQSELEAKDKEIAELKKLLAVKPKAEEAKAENTEEAKKTNGKG